MAVAEKVRVHLVLPEEIVAQVDALVGPRKRSQFIADAVAFDLNKRREPDFLPYLRESPVHDPGLARITTHVVLPSDLLEEVDKEIGDGSRSSFIAEAVERDLYRRETLRIFREFAGSMKGAGPPEWDTPEGTSQWVRNLREESDRRLGDWLDVKRHDP